MSRSAIIPPASPLNRTFAPWAGVGVFLMLFAGWRPVFSAPAADPKVAPTSQPVFTPWSAPPSRPASRPAAPHSQPAASASAPQRGDAVEPYGGLDHAGTPSMPPTELVMPPISAKPGIVRPLPRYDGREAEPPTAGDALVWVPRVLFFPGYLVMEYGVRGVLVAALTQIEKHHLIERTTRLLTFADGKAGLFPTVLFDFGLNPSVGFYFFYEDLFVKNNKLLLQAGFWFNEWIHLVATDSFKVFRNDEGVVTLRGEFFSRPDRVFSGINLVSRQGQETFFRQRQAEAAVDLRTYLTGLNRVTIGAVYRNVSTGDGEDFGELSIVDPGSPFVRGPDGEVDRTLAPRYGDTYHLISAQLRIELDTRTPDRIFNPGSGLRLELFGSFNADPRSPKLRFLRYGGEAAAFWDVSGLNHVLALRLYVEAMEDMGTAAIPLTERLVLGGPEYLRGFNEGFFRGDSAMVATLDYRYPVWALFDANLFFSMGNVFAGFFDTFHIKRMAATWGIGLRTNTSRDVSFDLLVAFGTKQFQYWDDDNVVDNVRVILGINQGF